jgi:hypothetical protein
MNQSGVLFLLFALIAFVVVGVILPWVLFMLFPQALLLFQVIMIFTIYFTVRSYLGDGIISLLLTGIFIYFLVFKYPEITASLWVFQIIFGFGVFSAIFWGSVAASSMVRR